MVPTSKKREAIWERNYHESSIEPWVNVGGLVTFSFSINLSKVFFASIIGKTIKLTKLKPLSNKSILGKNCLRVVSFAGALRNG